MYEQSNTYLTKHITFSTTLINVYLNPHISLLTMLIKLRV